VLDFLRGGAPAENPDPPSRARPQTPVWPGDGPPPQSRAPDDLTPPEEIPSAPPNRADRRAPQGRRGDPVEGFFDRLFGR
jgi:hypothetical protein